MQRVSCFNPFFCFNHRFTSCAASAASAASALHILLPTLAAPPDTDASGALTAGRRVVLLGAPTPSLVAATAGVWRAGGVAVPLHARDPPPALAAAAAAVDAAAIVVGDGVSDAAVAAVAAGGRVVARVRDVVAPATTLSTSLPPRPPPHAGALILFTSGTTGAPKPALHTHGSLAAHASALVGGWRLSPRDCIVNALPPHHIHGAVVALLAPLAGGAAVRLLPGFEAGSVWGALADTRSPRATVLMGVPTMYARLVAHVDAGGGEEEATAAAAAASSLRFAACGSAPCPAPLAARWQALAGAPLVERYGSTEAGIVVSAPLPVGREGGVARGCVGWPLPGVTARVVVCEGDTPPPSSSPATVTGELQISWPGAFAGYWGNPAATEAAFAGSEAREGAPATTPTTTAPTRWFKSGDIVAAGPTGTGPFTILGRASTDVFKVWGEQVSALAVEDALRSHPAVADAAVVGLPSEGARGAVVAAAVVVTSEWSGARDARGLGGTLATWVAARLPAAATPARVAIVEGDLPRNALGKVDKKELAGGKWVRVRRERAGEERG